jgi:hypothetical protein
MNKKFFFLGAIIASCIFTLTCNGDQNYNGANGNNTMSQTNGGPGSPSSKILQTSSTEQFAGTIRSVNRVSLPNETQIQLVLTTDQGDVLVIVGPASFVDQSKFKLQAGDKVTVTGYRVTGNGQQVILAAQIQGSNRSLQLLNENRTPVWASRGSQYSGTQHPYMPNSRY